MFVCAGDTLFEFAEDATAIDVALHFAARHAPVGVDADEDRARYAARHALPGMVVCTKADDLPGVECYPLTGGLALVSRPRVADRVER